MSLNARILGPTVSSYHISVGNHLFQYNEVQKTYKCPKQRFICIVSANLDNYKKKNY